MREEDWQPLVIDALASSLRVRREVFFTEVQVREGSIADIVGVVQNRLIVFELKMAEPGEVLAELGARGQRQLRHFSDAAHDVWIVTVSAGRQLELAYDGRVIAHEPMEAQLLPPHVGWMVYDVLSRQVVVMRAPAVRDGPPPHAGALVDKIDARLSRVRKELRCARVTT